MRRSRQTSLRVFATAAIALALTVGAGRVSGQDVRQGALPRREIAGTITDSASGRPVGGVAVLVAATGLETVTDSSGRYRLVGPLPAAVSVTVRRLGYVPVSRRIDLSRGNTSLDVALVTRPAALEGVRIRADSAAAFLHAEQPTSVMTAEEVQKRRGQTIGETIKALPGVSVIQYGPSIAKPVVRGLHSQRVATVNAGVPLEGQQWGGEHAPEIDAFAANEIEVIRGPGTILYGSGAIGGVVRVTPRALPVTGGIGGELTTNAFSNNRQGAASLLLEGANLALPALGTLGWRVQGSVRRAGDARSPGYYLPNTGFKEIDYSAAAGVQRSWGRSELDYSHFGTRLGLYLGAHVGNLDDLNRAMQDPLTSPVFAYALGTPDQRVTHDVVSWRTVLELPRASSIELSYGFQHNNREEFDNHGFASTDPRPAFALELFTHSLDIEYHHAPVGPFSGTLGVTGMRQGNLSPGRSFLIPQYRLYTGGLFGLEQVEMGRLTLTAGGRYDYRWQHAYQYGAPVVVSPDDQRAYSGLSGSLGASLKLGERWSLASTLGEAWRPPNVNERFSQGVHHGTAQYEIGDSTLVPERSINADLTLRHLGARSRLEISAFQNQINQFIYLRPGAPISTVRGAYPSYLYAHTDARLRGVEVTGQVDPVAALSLYANLNVVRGVDRITGDPLYDMPADRLTASARVFAPSSARWTSPYVELGTTLVRRQDEVPPVTVYKLPTSGYGLLNLEVGATALVIGGVRYEPSLAVRNLFDRAYRDYLSRYRLFVDEQGRDVVFRLTVPFGASHP
jgi:iron complex outermembrane receptor protein